MPDAIPLWENPYAPRETNNNGVRRMEDKKFYDSKAWKMVRDEKLRQQPYCEMCRTFKQLEVHHIKDRRGFPEFAYDLDNLAVLCKSDHMKNRHNYFAPIR